MNTIFLALTFAFIQTAGLTQTNNQIADIDKKVKEIKDNINNYKTEAFKYADSTLKTTYSDKKVVKMIILSYKDNHLDKRTEIFFSNGQMIFHEQIWTDSKGQIVNDEKSYLADHRLIKWIKTDNKEVDKNSDDFKWWNKKLSESSKSWKKDTK